MSRKAILSGLFLALAVHSGARANDAKPGVKPPDDSLAPLFSEIRFAAENDRWKQPDWSIAKIEAQIEKLVAACREATGDKSLQVPVRLADIIAGNVPPAIGISELVIGRDVEVARAHSCIILADGSAKVSHAQNSIIVARHAVQVSYARNSIIIGGAIADVSHAGPRENEESLIICPGPITGDSTRGSTFSSLVEPRVSHVNNARFVKPAGSNVRAANYLAVDSEKLTLAAGAEHGIGQKIVVLGFVRPSGIVFKYEGRRYVASLGKPITDEADQPVESLEGWKLSMMNDQVALLAKDEAAVILRLTQGN